MSTTASNSLHVPSKPSSPASPTSSFHSQQSSARSFIHLNNSTPIRGQTAPFPSTPTSSTTNSMEPPPGMAYSEFIRGWTDSDVSRWLNGIKCGNNAETFKANDIRGDILLELDHNTLKEMGVASIGDRLRIINAVKILRQKAASKVPPMPVPEQPSTPPGQASDPVTRSASTRRLESGRPAPLQLNPTLNRNDLPRLVREQSLPDSANTNHSTRLLAPATPSATTPITSHTPANSRLSLPQVPPHPRGQPPLPPSSRRLGGRRTPTPTDPPALTSQPLPPAPTPALNLQSSSTTSRSNYHLPADPRPGSAGGRPTPPRASSPNLTVPPPRNLSRQAGLSHNRNGSGSNGWASSNHPYANANAALQPPAQPSNGLSPIAESFGTHPNTPSPPTTINVQTGGRITTANPSLDDLRRYIVKFVLPEEQQQIEQSCKINISDMAGGVEILEKVLKKLGKGSNRATGSENHNRVLLEGGGLSVDGWSVYMDRDESGPPLTEGELLSICHSPDHLTREQGLILRKTARARPYGARDYLGPGSRNTKRASSISILSGLGVRDPERALEPASSDTHLNQPTIKKPSKLHNFFGQRPPSELITTHLTEYFPYTEKKVLERTARNSVMRTSSTLGRRDSTISSISNSHLQSRFSISTQGSSGQISVTPPRTSMSSLAPPVSDHAPLSPDEIPRVSLSTEDGRSIDLPAEPSPTSPHVLPPIPFSTETLSESLQEITSPRLSHRTPSTSSRRTSYMTELRSKKDRSDTASIMTVDQITAEVESRRESLAIDRMAIDSGSDIDEWTKVGSDDDLGSPTLVKEAEVEVEVAVAPEEDEKEFEEDTEGEEEEEEEEEVESENEDETGKATTSGGRKWIKGALIGSGSFGQVYLGMDASNGLLMAVKQVELPKGSAPNEERKKQMLSALEREIELLKDLQHDNIVQYLYSSLDGNHLNIFLEYVPGGSVTALLRNYGAFEEPLVKNFVRQILLGLNYLHERDIIHRDIKGANILVDNKGGIKISDFGISKKVETHVLMNKAHRISLQGSVFWMAPEVVKQTEHTSKADIWSVGCLVVEMFTGEHPWSQLTQMQAIFKIGSSAKPTIPSDISAEAQDFLAKTFDLEPENRPSAPELLLHPWITSKHASA